MFSKTSDLGRFYTIGLGVTQSSEPGYSSTKKIFANSPFGSLRALRKQSLGYFDNLARPGTFSILPVPAGICPERGEPWLGMLDFLSR